MWQIIYFVATIIYISHQYHDLNWMCIYITLYSLSNIVIIDTFDHECLECSDKTEHIIIILNLMKFSSIILISLYCSVYT